MKKSVSLFAVISIIIFLGGSCKNTTTKNNVPGAAATTTPVEEGLILIGRDIITEVVVKPDTLGDPWEVEKVKGYNGQEMFASLFENIKSKKVTVYDCFTDAPLDPSDVMKMKDKIGTDVSKIGKIQFLEDWYFNPVTSSISKKIKSASFGYETIREGGLPTGYTALFQLKTK